MLKNFFIALMAVFLAYYLIPSYWARNNSTKVLRKGDTDIKLVALTFDDGPNPFYTPKVLDILKEYDIRATFFVLGKGVEENPEIIKRMEAEGHDIGCHSYSHRHAWLMSPLTTYRDMEKSRDALVKILGEAPSRYRPPWGTYNAMTLFSGNKLALKPTHWSVEAEDWAKETGVADIYKKVIDRVDPGSIIVLHDNRGAEGAPERTIMALPLIIETLKDKGYRFVSLDEMENITEEDRQCLNLYSDL